MKKTVKRIKPHAQEEVLKVFSLLDGAYPNAKTELTFGNEFELLISVILSAQCTDAQVNRTTPDLFAKYPNAAALAKAKGEDVETLIRSCGFYRMKAKAIVSAAQDLVARFCGKVPRTLEELVTLRGVGRKTASVILNQAFDVPAIAVDTHVMRVSQRLGWARHPTPEKIEEELKILVPKSLWAKVNSLLILHGRRICKARKPLCEMCDVKEYCRYYKRSLARS